MSQGKLDDLDHQGFSVYPFCPSDPQGDALLTKKEKGWHGR